MPNTNKFAGQRQLITLEFLTNDRFSGDEDVEGLLYRAINDDLSMTEVTRSIEDVDGPTLARLTIAQGSDPEFFGLTEDGTPVDD